MLKKKTKKIHSDDLPFGHHPFESLKGFLKNKIVSPDLLPRKTSPTREGNDFSENQLFFEAMKGVNPIIGNGKISGNSVQVSVREQPVYMLEENDLSRLTRLVSHGEGFIVADTPEYMEGTGYNVRRELARRLHEGDFAIQTHLDLHGMNVETAGEEFDTFMKASYLSGKRAVLIIHGRGLSSPGEAILKYRVRKWLSQSYWRKRVLAYASAQTHDGGAGATYVLFRERPMSKKSGKAK
jgi:DNA-nicking Smr family endonuclease